MFFAYQQEPSETQWAGTIHLIDLNDIIRVEFEHGENKQNNRLHVYTKHSMITIKRADAIADFRGTFNQHLYQSNYVQNFLPENVNDEPAAKAD